MYATTRSACHFPSPRPPIVQSTDRCPRVKIETYGYFNALIAAASLIVIPAEEHQSSSPYIGTQIGSLNSSRYPTRILGILFPHYYFAAGGQARSSLRIRVWPGFKHSPVHRPKEGGKNRLKETTLAFLWLSIQEPGCFNSIIFRSFSRLIGKEERSDFVIETGVVSRFPRLLTTALLGTVTVRPRCDRSIYPLLCNCQQEPRDGSITLPVSHTHHPYILASSIGSLLLSY